MEWTWRCRSPAGSPTKSRLIDFDDPRRNDYLAVSQLTVVENRKKRRLDAVVFVNGLPLALFEIKSPSVESATIDKGFDQIRTYKRGLPTFFTFNEVLVATDGIEARAGTLTADWDRFMPWRTVEGRDLAPNSLPQLDVLVAGMFDRRRLLDLLRSFIVFEDDGRGGFAKKMAAYHQYHAVHKAVDERLEWAELPDYYRPRPGMFVAQVVGESMNRIVPNGGWALFRLNPQGTREGKVVLAQHREIQDTDTGGHYTLKRYHSDKERAPDGTWRHTGIVLRPDSDRDGYEPIVIEEAEENELQVVAELIGVIPG